MTPTGKDRKKNKKPTRTNSKAPGAESGQVEAAAGDGRRAARNIAQVREKLSAAIEDPNMREQIVRAMRSLFYEDQR